MKIEELLKEAFLSFEEDNLYDAAVYLETVLEIDSNNMRALLMLSRIYSTVEDYERALKYCEKAYKNYGNDNFLSFHMSISYFELRRYA